MIQFFINILFHFRLKNIPFISVALEFTKSNGFFSIVDFNFL